MKKCPCCLKTKPLCNFWMNRSAPNGRQAYCKMCHRAISLGRRHEAAVTVSEMAARAQRFVDRKKAVLDMRRTLAEKGLL